MSDESLAFPYTMRSPMQQVFSGQNTATPADVLKLALGLTGAVSLAALEGSGHKAPTTKEARDNLLALLLPQAQIPKSEDLKGGLNKVRHTPPTVGGEWGR